MLKLSLMPVSQMNISGLRLGDEFSCSCGRIHKVSTKEIFLSDDLASLLEKVLEFTDIEGPILLVTGRKTWKIGGALAERYFSEQGYQVMVKESLRADISTISDVEKYASHCSLAVAVGGGTVIDTCKYAAHRAGIPFISIPTTISHDGIASPVASIFVGSRRTSIVTSPPQIVLIATSIIRASPRQLIASGCADILAKTTALRDWLLGHQVKEEYLCRTTFGITASAVLDLMRFIDNRCEEISELALAAVKCGLAMTLVGSSRPCSGAEHLFSHYLDMIGEGVGLHGEQVGLGAILMAAKYEDSYGPPMQGFELSSMDLKSYLSRAGAPTRLSEIKVPAETAVRALLECKNLRPERYTILHHSPLTRSAALKLLKMTDMLTEA